MAQYIDGEYHLPAQEIPAPGDEYNDTYAGREEYENHSVDPDPQERRAGRRKRLHKLILLQTAAALSVVVAVNAAFGQDPLGSDFLAPSEQVLPPLPVTPVTPVDDEPEAYDDVFPALPNLDPDFAGDYAWAGMGSEEYILLVNGEEYTYLHAGTYYTANGVTAASLPGASYDSSTNTLTLNDFRGGKLETNLMGNGFKVELIGDSSLDQLKVWGAMYGGSVTFTGSGHLTLNESGAAADGVGLYLECEDSPSCVMVDREATVEVFGTPAVMIHRTTLEQAIYCLRPVKTTGGTGGAGAFVEYTVPVTDEDGNVVMDENGQPVTEIWTVENIGAEQGMTLYDYSVLGGDGSPSGHVLFAPGE